MLLMVQPNKTYWGWDGMGSLCMLLMVQPNKTYWGWDGIPLYVVNGAAE